MNSHESAKIESIGREICRRLESVCHMSSIFVHLKFLVTYKFSVNFYRLTLSQFIREKALRTNGGN